MPGVTDVQITIAPGRAVVPVPEGNRYLGFVFARDRTPGPCGTRVAPGVGRLDVRVDGDDDARRPRRRPRRL